MIEWLWEIGWYGSAVWLGWALNTFWQAFKRRIRFRVNIGEHIAEDPEQLRRMMTALRVNNESLRAIIQRKDREIARLRRNLQERNS